MYDENLLFDGGRLRDVEALELRDIYSSRQLDVREELGTWDSERLLATAEADIVKDLLARHSIACPVLHRERAEQLPRDQDWLMTRLAIAMPFDGDTDIFRVGHAWPGLLQARAKKGAATEGELFLVWADNTSGEADPPQEFNARLDKIEQQLSALGPGIVRMNADLFEWVSSFVASRRKQLLADGELATALGIPIRKRADAAQFEVPAKRRKISTQHQPAGTSRFEQEPFLPEEQYEQALAVLRNARNALERSPSMTTHLDEERIRDLLLFFLNGQFEGAAAGEVFNRNGKADILIRAGDRNVFIAECKIFAQKNKQRVEKVVRCALDQLLSRYLAWRDTKAALLLFIRSGQPTSIISNAIAEIERHPNFVPTLSAGEDGERYDCILRANDDPSREIRLAFLPFALLDYSDEG